MRRAILGLARYYGREFLSTGEPARYLGVNATNTIKRWIDKGLFPN